MCVKMGRMFGCDGCKDETSLMAANTERSLMNVEVCGTGMGDKIYVV